MVKWPTQWGPHAGDVVRTDEIDRAAIKPTFAVVKDGRWYERGEMGWWDAVADK
jgi:hypothetical protein